MLFDYEYFKREVLTLTGINLSCYKESQMKRRIDNLISKNRIEGYDKYVFCLRTDRRMFEEFVNHITINVSEFYRDIDQWKVMEEKAIPELIQRFGKTLKVWSAACSTGDEPYSLVMAMSRHLPLANIRVHATDLDRQIIETAKQGVYPEKSIASVPADLKRRYFRKTGTEYKISDEIKSRVEFREPNLLKDAYPIGCHLIVCRNVMIYFDQPTKDALVQRFYDATVPGGYFMISHSENLGKNAPYQTVAPSTFQKR